MPRVLTAVLFVLGLIALVLAAIGFFYITRGSPISRVLAVGDDGGPPAAGNAQFRRTVEMLAGVNLLPGNDVEVLLNGDETFPRLYADLRAATRSVTLQMYYAQPGQVADSIQAILVDRARAGVQVFTLFDAFGAQNLTEEYFQTLRDAGVHVAHFRPIHWYSVDKVSHRSHIRVVVIDGSIAYTGGFGIDDKWLGDGRHPGQWRETNVRFMGPSVMQHQATFVAGWAEATGTLLAGDLLFPPNGFASDGNRLAGLLYMAPTIGSTAAERYLALSIASARHSLYIANSYFVPDDDFRRLLTDAAKRGVDVRVLTTSDKTDVKTTWFAGRARYEELLAAGVRIYEYEPSMMHAKTMVVDAVWSSIGTLNFDNRSLVFNDETNLLVLDAGVGERMRAIFLEDLRYAKEIDLETFRERPWVEKLREQGANLMSRLL